MDFMVKFFMFSLCYGSRNPIVVSEQRLVAHGDALHRDAWTIQSLGTLTHDHVTKHSSLPRGISVACFDRYIWMSPHMMRLSPYR